MKPRTPRPIYREGAVMEFNVKDNEIYYSISTWNKEGTNQSVLVRGKLNGRDPSQVFDSAQQLFSTVRESLN